ncbi:MAG: NADH-quinone oxidoreductase subunit N [Dehalococcoidia bacterium]
MNLWLFLPEFLVAGLAFLILGTDLVLPPARKSLLAYGGALGLGGIMAATLTLQGEEARLYGGLFLVDGYALFFKEFFLLLGILILLASVEFVEKNLSHAGEYYGLILFSVLAMMLMTASGELLTAYISLELLSFCLYILASYGLHDPRSNEAGVKFILLGAFSSAILLYGLSLVYGLAGTTEFVAIAGVLGSGEDLGPGLLVGLVLVIAGFGFKVAAVPFHMWAPDVYEGAPLPITAYLSVASKAAAFALLLRLFAVAFMPAMDEWRGIMAGLAAVTMTVGNLVAIPQRNIKRLLAYSSIGQAGYLLVGLAALSPMASSGMVFHLAGFAVTNLAAFVAIIAYYNLSGKEDIPDYAGLAERSPLLATTLAVAFFSLAGLPFFAGFTTKFYLFAAAAREGLLWLVALAMVNSLISLYYYLLVIKQMYMVPPSEPGRLRVPGLLKGILVLLLFGIVIIGIYPAPLLEAIDGATRFLFP